MKKQAEKCGFFLKMIFYFNSFILARNSWATSSTERPRTTA